MNSNRLKAIYMNKYGLLLLESDKHNYAAIQFENAFKLISTKHDYAAKCAHSHDKSKNYAAWKEFYLKALELKPNKYRYHGEYGKLLQDMKQYKFAIRTDPENVKHRIAYWQLLIDDMKQFDVALDQITTELY